ncbi:MAG: FxsA family protein [Cellvibrionaceae bacterium]
MPILLALFIIMPIAEMWVLIQVGMRIGALSTIGLVLLTAIVGLALLRQQGLSTLLRANQRMQAGQIPAQEMGEGIFLAVGGALLLTPGFITDIFGFTCLIPGVRKVLLGRFLKSKGFGVNTFHVDNKMGAEEVHTSNRHSPGGSVNSSSRRKDQTGNIIDGEYHRDD